MDNDARPDFRSSRHAREVRVASWQDAEELAVWHMREYLDLTDAALTNPGADGGIDARAEGAVAQVKHHSTPAGSPDLQRLVGAGHATPLRLFYSHSGYTLRAHEYAEQVGVALFQYSIYGEVVPANRIAEELTEREASPAWDPSDETDPLEITATVDSLARSLEDALRQVEATRETDLPGVFVCAEIGVQIAIAAAIRDEDALNAEHDALDREIASCVRAGLRKPSSWIPLLHEWDKRRAEAMANGSKRALLHLLRLVDAGGVVRRWPLSVGADMAYLQLPGWPQREWLTEDVALRLTQLDPLRMGTRWCRGATWHVNHDLPWRSADLNVRFYDELVPDVGDWRAMLQLDDARRAPGGGPLWE